MRLDLDATTENYIKMLNQFHCQRCGGCCTKPQTVVLKPGEYEFLIQYVPQLKDLVITIDSEYFIKARPCPFYKAGCSIYPIRPQVCRQYPFNITYLKDGKRYMTQQDCKWL